MVQSVYLHDELAVTGVPYSGLEEQVSSGQMLRAESKLFLTQWFPTWELCPHMVSEQVAMAVPKEFSLPWEKSLTTHAG